MTTPNQAREDADLYRATGIPVSVTVVYSLAKQVEALTKERDDAVYACGLVVQRCDRLVIDRDALMSAAKLAWVAIVELRYSNSTDKSRSVSEFAVQALREAGVQ